MSSWLSQSCISKEFLFQPDYATALRPSLLPTLRTIGDAAWTRRNDLLALGMGRASLYKSTVTFDEIEEMLLVLGVSNGLPALSEFIEKFVSLIDWNDAANLSFIWRHMRANPNVQTSLGDSLINKYRLTRLCAAETFLLLCSIGPAALVLMAGDEIIDHLLFILSPSSPECMSC